MSETFFFKKLLLHELHTIFDGEIMKHYGWDNKSSSYVSVSFSMDKSD